MVWHLVVPGQLLTYCLSCWVHTAALPLPGEAYRQQLQPGCAEEAVHVQDKQASSVTVQACPVHGRQGEQRAPGPCSCWKKTSAGCLSNVPCLQEDKIAVLVATVTDDARLFEVPKLRVCALRFTETARARIVKVKS